MKKLLTLFLTCIFMSANALQIADSIFISPSDNVVNVVLSADEYNSWAQEGVYGNNIPTITKMLYQHFNDDFDMIMLITNEKTKPETISYYGINTAIANSVKGIGRTIYSNSKRYGSEERLFSIMHLPYLDAIKYGPTLHEFCHCWANYAIPTAVSGHWGICGGNDRGQLGGFKQSTLQTNVDGIANKYSVEAFGTNANGGNGVPYNELELYLMGMLPIDSVHEFDAFPVVPPENTGYQDESHKRYTFIADTCIHYTQSKIIEELGERIPDYKTSQKEFKALFVVLSSSELTSDEWASYESGITWFCQKSDNGSYLYNFWEATRGIGSIDPSNLSASLKKTCIIASGTCGDNGDNLTWTLSCDGMLTFSGEGAFESIETNAPPSDTDISQHYAWYEYRDQIKNITIESGITDLGNLYFGDYTYLDTVFCLGATPPTIEHFPAIPDDHGLCTGIYICGPSFPYRPFFVVSCESFDLYKNAWSEYQNHFIGERLLPYQIYSNETDTEKGYIDYLSVANICDSIAVIEAIPTMRMTKQCKFIRWEDGNTDNPRRIKMTQDTMMTAIFEEIVPVVSEYDITFKDSGTGSDNSTKRTNIEDIVKSGSDLIASIDVADNIYNAREGRGIKFGTSSKAGTLTFTLATPTVLNQIEVYAMWYNAKGENLIIVNGTELELTSEIAKYIVECEGQEISQITIATPSKRAYVVGLNFIEGTPEPCSTPFVLTTNVNDPAMGSIVVSQEPTCENNNTAIVAAEANDGYHFVQWSDGNANASREIRLKADLELTATFEADGEEPEPVTGEYDITFKDNGSESDSSTKQATIEDLISAGSELVASIDVADNVYNARAGRGIKLGTSSKTGTLTLTLANAPVLSQIEVYAMQYNDKGENKLTVNNTEFELTSEIAKYVVECYNQTVNTITLATPAKRAYVVGINLIAGSGGTCPYTLNAHANNPDWGTVTVTQEPTCENDNTARVIAQANDGYEFVQWSDGSTAAVYKLTLTSDLELIAEFKSSGEEPTCVDAHVLTATANDEAMGSVEVTSEYACETGTTATATATANAGYHFVQWSDGNTDKTRTLVLTQDTVLTAVFEVEDVPCEAVVKHVYETACDSYIWNGNELKETGEYTTKLTTVAGCDSTVVLHLTINQSVIIDVSATTIAGVPYLWNGQEYSESGDYSFVLESVNGCDSIITLHLIVEDNPCSETAYGEETQKTCDGKYTWYGKTYTESGDYQTTLTGPNGCDSIVTLHLTIGHEYEADTLVTTCDEFTWHGETYTESGNYIYMGKTREGCDSIVTLHLYINRSETQELTVTACDRYYWAETDKEYTESGDYTSISTTEQGCTRTVILHLTINKPYNMEEYVEAFDSYEWNGMIYTESGDYKQYFITANGCDSIVTLHLTIVPSCVPFVLNLRSADEQMGTVAIQQVPDCENGQQAIISATPTDSKRYRFNEWSDGNKNNPRTLTLSGDMVLYAQFGTIDYTLTATAENSRAGKVTGSGIYPYGTEVQINAIANAGWQFDHWSDGNTENPRTIEVTHDITLQAVFSTSMFTIIAEPNDETLGYTTGSGQYAGFAFAILEAIPYGNNRFVGWSDGVQTRVRKTLVLEDAYYVAIFENPEVFYITAEPTDYNAGEVVGGGYHAYKEQVALTAIPHTGYRFTQWHDGNTDNPRNIVVLHDASFYAQFESTTALENTELRGISISGQTINIEGHDGEDMTITTIVGQLIYNGKVQPTITLNQSGIYIIRIADKVMKVNVGQ